MMKSSLSIFSFLACAFGVVAEKYLPKPESQIFTVMFTPRRFCNWGSFGFLIDLEFSLTKFILLILNFFSF